MADFSGLQDWSLQAIVRGYSSDFSNSTSTYSDSNSCFDTLDLPGDEIHGQSFSFPCLFGNTTAVSGDDLEEFFKPFYSVSSPPISAAEEVKEQPEIHEQKQSPSDQSTVASTTAYTPRYKRRKNQHKRQVLHVTAEGLSADMWAWRKYGQKPIKGSPYPRSYYRCSSSKGCPARKQVEQSCSDSGMYIITYTAEHSHSQPTRRNSLAGTVRRKFPTSSKDAAKANSGPKMARVKDCIANSPMSAGIPFPTTPVTSSIEEGFLESEVKQEITDGFEEGIIEGNSVNDFVIQADTMFDDDFFAGLGDLDGFVTEFSHGKYFDNCDLL